MEIMFQIAVPDPERENVREMREVEVFAPDRDMAEATVFAKYPTAVILGYRIVSEPEPAAGDEDEEEEGDE